MGEYPLSDTYVLDMIDQMDLKHATGIISFNVQFTELEFNVDVHTPTIRQHSMSNELLRDLSKPSVTAIYDM